MIIVIVLFFGSIFPDGYSRGCLNAGEEDQMEIYGYHRNPYKIFITWFLQIITLGLARLVFHWYPEWYLYATHSSTTLSDATSVLIVDVYKKNHRTYFVEMINLWQVPNMVQVHLCDGRRKYLQTVRTITCKKLVYIWLDDESKFVRLCGLERDGTTKNQFYTNCNGLSTQEQALKRTIYGPNEIDVPVQSIGTLLVLEALTPFYVFQLFSLIVWMAEYYYYYTIAIIIMSLIGITTSVIQTRKNQKNLKGTVSATSTIQVVRSDGTIKQVPTTDLVPNDLIILQTGRMHCDAILLNGTCIVNESMLTGESVPVTKTPIESTSEMYDVKSDAGHTLFCGTDIIQIRSDRPNVLAIVVRTGYHTTKGQLVRSILYPPPADFKFDQDSYKFIMILTVVAIMGFIYTVVSKYSRSISPMDILIKALDLVTIAVPPALPAAMTVGKLYALNRLKKLDIFCMNSRVVNVSGSVDCVCFDKTGTLTEDGLDVLGVVQSVNGKLGEASLKVPEGTTIFNGMLTCHSLAMIDGELRGDPLDVKMFQLCGWYLDDSNSQRIVRKNTESLKIMHQFQFSSTLQRMSVIVRIGEADQIVYCKGAPEKIADLCLPHSIPSNLKEYLSEHTRQGYRLIAIACKQVEPQDEPLKRFEAEANLEFLGLIILENKLKPQTAKVIKILHDANMKMVMITGDNLETATSVARESGLIPENHTVIEAILNEPKKYQTRHIDFHPLSMALAPPKSTVLNVENNIQAQPYDLVMSGGSWACLHRYHRNIMTDLLRRTTVFARMSGKQKQQLVEELQDLGYYVAMCGDGANDCGALKAAHVGISLSEAEASVASPFTSRRPDISCVPEVVREGRAALVTSFGVFKLMLCYSLTEFASVILLYSIDTNLTSLQFLFIDICLILNFASVFGNTRAYPHLSPQPPMTTLFHFIPLTSLSIFMLITVSCQVLAYYQIQTYDWFVGYNLGAGNSSYENYAVFCVSMFQYVAMALVFSEGAPYRRPIYTNHLLSISIVLTSALCVYIALTPCNWLRDALELRLPTWEARWIMLSIAALSCVLCFIAEEVLNRLIRPRLNRQAQN